MVSADRPKLTVNYNEGETSEVEALLARLNLNTVCKAANCPNLGECYKRHTATFMILGNICTRNCRYCNISTGKPEVVDPEEPHHIARAAQALKLRHVVITSVTRDDLPDGGASQFVNVMAALRQEVPSATIEVLIPDFRDKEGALEKVLNARPDVLNHNIECVRELFPVVRPSGNYELSLKILNKSAKYSREHADSKIVIKSGAMLGLGEDDTMLQKLFDDLAANGCELLTLGQYLRPTKSHHPVDRYVKPAEYEKYKAMAKAAGIKFVVSGALVRSSYHADEAFAAVFPESATL